MRGPKLLWTWSWADDVVIRVPPEHVLASTTSGRKQAKPTVVTRSRTNHIREHVDHLA